MKRGGDIDWGDVRDKCIGEGSGGVKSKEDRAVGDRTGYNERGKDRVVWVKQGNGERGGQRGASDNVTKTTALSGVVRGSVPPHTRLVHDWLCTTRHALSAVLPVNHFREELRHRTSSARSFPRTR